MRYWSVLLVLCLSVQTGWTQFTVDGQIIQRGEYRHGFGQLIPEEADPAVFVAQRARLQAGYEKDGLKLYVSVQDIRTWGNTPQVKPTDGLLSVHEAYGQVRLGQHWWLKLGRQELNYDNFRFIGNLDWALQGRAHDFALVKYEKNDLKWHFGGGFNQDGQSLSGTLFTTPNQYKVAQFMRVENTKGRWHYSVLAWNDGRQYIDRNDQGEIIGRGVRYRLTLGVPMLVYTVNNTKLSAFYYHQLGKDVTGRTLNAFDANLQVKHQIDGNEERGSKTRLVAGVEWLSGTEQGAADNRSYSPQYGTNHLYNGYMDHFFVGGRFENQVGLQDYYAKVRHDFSKKVFAQLDGHVFYSYATPRNMDNQALDPYLGTEIDLSVGIIATPAFSIQTGYSHLLASDTYSTLTGVTNAQPVQNWGYVMLIYRPNMKNKFIGILL